MNIRHAMAAGTFYESSPSSCEHHAQKLLEAGEVTQELPKKLYGGLVPHAGWMYSGRLAAMTMNALSQGTPIQTAILLGADHRGSVEKGEVFDSGVWRTPLGEALVDDRLAKALLDASPILRSNPQAHLHEHSLEVQVPLLQELDPRIKIVPVGVPPTEVAVEMSKAIARAVADYDSSAGVVILGSTDLTHHGGHFGSPGGKGKAGVEWSAANDRRMIDLILGMNARQVIAEAREHGDAYGAGAIAATVAACGALGAARGILLEYTNSYEVIHAMYPTEPDETTVGYASVVFA